MHTKRNEMSKKWPLPRKMKGRKFIATPNHSSSSGISLLFILRDILKIAKTRKEARYITLNGLVKINHKVKKDEDSPVGVFDVVSLNDKLNYRLEIVNKKFKLREIHGNDAEEKIVKIIGKKIIGKDKIQMNLSDGQNFITKEKFSVGDSVVVNTKENKIKKMLKLREGANIEVVLGKHAGEKGKLLKFEELARGRNYLVKLNDKDVVLPYKSILVIENDK
ncbi:MAG: S4 domain-containing protein [Candidatus Pacearchaeota archaeon]